MTEPSNSVLRYVRQSLAWSFWARALMLAGNLFISIFLVRLLAKDQVGTIFYLQSLAAFLAIVLHFCVDNYLARALPLASQAGETSARQSLLLGALAVCLAISAAVSFLLWLAAQSDLLTKVMPRDMSSVLMAFALVWGLLLALQRFVSGAHRALLNGKRAGLHSGALNTAIALVALLGFSVSGNAPDVQTVLTVFLLALIADVLLGALPLKLLRPWPGSAAIRARAREALIFASPLVLTQLVLFAASLSGPLILGARSTLEEVAVFSIASRVAILMNLPLSLLNPVLLPLVAPFVSAGALQPLQLIARLIATAATVFTLTGIAMLSINPQWLLSTVFDASYAAAALPTLILCAGVLGESITGSNGVVLNQAGFQKLAMWLTVACSAIAVVPAVLVAEYYGAVGVACCFALASLVQQATITLFAAKRVGIKTWASPSLALRLVRSPLSVMTEFRAAASTDLNRQAN